ncbi:hypothetical protein CC86DRAFT_437421, partial [Ophiobolus disseminans]
PGSDSTEREGAPHSSRSIDGWGHSEQARPLGVPEAGADATPFSDHHTYQPIAPQAMYAQRSYGSDALLAPGMYSNNSSSHSVASTPHGVPYQDSPYNRYSSTNLYLAILCLSLTQLKAILSSAERVTKRSAQCLLTGSLPRTPSSLSAISATSHSWGAHLRASRSRMY